MRSDNVAMNIGKNVLADVSELAPEDVFEEEVLTEWAKDNGYVKEKE